MAIISLFMLFSISDVVVVKKYYSTITKSQFRELTDEIKKTNVQKDKVVTYWSWLIPYFFDNESGIQVHPNTLEEYIIGLKNGSINKKSFWYLDGHFRPFNLTQEDQDFLNENFILHEKLEYYDSWANYYESKTESTTNKTGILNLKTFNAKNYDTDGNILLFENTILKTELIELEKGNYKLVINGNSLPDIPINNENAHLKIKINSNEIGEYNLSENKKTPEKIITFNQEESRKIRIQIIFDNDYSIGKKDRNLIIYSIKLEKL